MNYLELKLISPSRLVKLNQIDSVIDIAKNVETISLPPDGSYLLMSAQEEFGSSYRRSFGFGYPVKIWVNQISSLKPSAKRLQSHTLLFWKHKEGCKYLVSFNTNSPEDNFEGEYDNALDWLINELVKRLGFTQ